MEYNTLLLSSGGGVFLPAQQSNQVQNTANVFIGLGGTGVDCLAKLKKEIHKRLKPDDPTAPIPDYRHIQFLGVDSDIYSERKIDPTDFFNISMNDIKLIFTDKQATDKKPHLNWLRTSELGSIFDLGNCDPSGLRQIGRLKFMNKSAEFLEILKSKIQTAKEGLTSAQLNIHLFRVNGKHFGIKG